MSHYDAVVPVRFDVLRKQILPAWLDVLDNRLRLREFAARFIHPQSEWLSDLMPPDDEDWDFQFDVSSAYIAWFRSLPPEQWLRDDAPTWKKAPWFASDLLALAMLGGAAALLPDEPTYPFPTQDPEIYYGRSHEPPFALVAGTKNRFFFLEAFFEMGVWERKRNIYAYHRKSSAPVPLCELLERLFLGVRVFPGTRILARSPAWQASDDPYLAGFLSPAEMASLVEYLPLFEEPLAQSPQWQRLHFDLFADRLQRAAKLDAGLVTFFDML